MLWRQVGFVECWRLWSRPDARVRYVAPPLGPCARCVTAVAVCVHAVKRKVGTHSMTPLPGRDPAGLGGETPGQGKADDATAISLGDPTGGAVVSTSSHAEMGRISVSNLTLGIGSEAGE